MTNVGLGLAAEGEPAASSGPKQVVKTCKNGLGKRRRELNLVLLVNKKYPEPKHICSVLNSPQISIIRKWGLLIPDQGERSGPSASLHNLRLCYCLRGNRTSAHCHWSNCVLYGVPLTQDLPTPLQAPRVPCPCGERGGARRRFPVKCETAIGDQSGEESRVHGTARGRKPRLPGLG